MSNQISTDKIVEKSLYVSFISALQIIPIVLISNIANNRQINLEAVNNFNYDLLIITTNYTLGVLALTILTYLILETFTKKKINYFQYFLISSSITINLLLNLSMGEFIGFIPAFFISAAMTIFLNTAFSGLLSQDFKNPSITLLSTSTYYAGLFFYLQSSDYNLLITSILAFISVFMLMIGSTMITKK